MRPQLPPLDELNERLGEIHGQNLDLKEATDCLLQNLLKVEGERKSLKLQIDAAQRSIEFHREYIEDTNRERVKLEGEVRKLKKELGEHTDSQDIEELTVSEQINTLKNQVRNLKYCLTTTVFSIVAVVIGVTIAKVTLKH